MKCKSLLFAGLMFMAVGLFSCQPSDSNVQQDVNAKISSVSGVTADVKDGVVTLNGTVMDDATKAAAEDSVKTVKGVKSVSNNITVQAPPPPPAMGDSTNPSGNTMPGDTTTHVQ
jgi:hyperosmotically inducible periplasmic protein